MNDANPLEAMPGNRPGAAFLKGAVDCHVHACPHLNGRSVDVFQAVREAAAHGMSGIGLMDNFANSAGYAALARRELGDLGVDVFGGLIMEPQSGGISVEAVRASLGCGYLPDDGARFVSLPTHHTQNIARLEGRSPAYLETCLAIPESGELPEPLFEILDLIAEHDVVLNTGHISGPEAVRLAGIAKRRGGPAHPSSLLALWRRGNARHRGRGRRRRVLVLFPQPRHPGRTHACRCRTTHGPARILRTNGGTYPGREPRKHDPVQRLRRLCLAAPG